jgi:hypothetical protein
MERRALGPAHAAAGEWPRATTDRRWSGRHCLNLDGPASVRPGGLHDRTTGRHSSAASATSLLVRRPLRRELARTVNTRGGLTTDSLIERGQEEQEVLLWVSVVRATVRWPRVRYCHALSRPEPFITTAQPNRLLFLLFSCSRQQGSGQRLPPIGRLHIRYCCALSA